MTFNILKKYPPGFDGVLVTQTCFGFYGLKSLFILYVIAQFSLSEDGVIHLFATLMALCYAASLIEGWIADHSLGTKTPLSWGAYYKYQGFPFSCFLRRGFAFSL